MLDRLLFLAQRGADSPVNVWFRENPLVLGLLAIFLGVVIGGYGVFELITGAARDKFGNKHEGVRGSLLAIIRIVAGAAACLFGMYKIIFG